MRREYAGRTGAICPKRIGQSEFMNKADGKELNDIFFRYYYERPIESMEHKRILDKLAGSGLIEYKLGDDGVAYAMASPIGRGMHYCPPPSSAGL